MKIEPLSIEDRQTLELQNMFLEMRDNSPIEITEEFWHNPKFSKLKNLQRRWRYYRSMGEYWDNPRHQEQLEKNIRKGIQEADDELDEIIQEEESEEVETVEDYMRELNEKYPNSTYTETSVSEAVIVPASEIKPEHMKYLWPGRIVCGSTTVYFGMPGECKSTQALDVAARISTGAGWPNSMLNAPKGSILLIAQEDAVREVILWRYKAMNGDPAKLYIFQGIKRDSAYLDWLDITKDLPSIENQIKNIPDLKLIIIDPISAYFGKADTYKMSEVRATLGPLKALAEKYEIAILLIHHANKNSKQDSLHRISGSTAFGDFARQVWLFGSDKEDETRKLMVSAKKSYGPPTTGLAFRVKQVDPTDENSIKLIYETTLVQESAQDIFAEQKGRGRPARERERAEEFLKKILADGAVPRKIVIDTAAIEKIDERTLRRAVSELKLRRVWPKTGKHAEKYCWRLPQNRSN